MFDTWNVLGVIAIISMIVFFAKGKNAVWGGLTAGVIIGLIIAIVYVILDGEFYWSILKKAAIVGVLSGIAAELLSTLAKRLKN